MYIEHTLGYEGILLSYTQLWMAHQGALWVFLVLQIQYVETVSLLRAEGCWWADIKKAQSSDAYIGLSPERLS